ncbi:DHH family phosphoesterase [Heyndrickxia oleronia]|uniref:Cyclic-di-AMP phosphodiesterase n=1 Tax=Heyndrickxia oleronia TaxID=38875 RepID=A0A8E2IBA8_9BACI|nr:DHH family phosphoesterase [Heyndrickxia oleronia]NYV66344.1 DHH family phosphoesterase [Bacillus sp. Gen3]MBU5211449.1 DHH family phosphoesterase [Heyndrickxia oleronia]MCI1590273.1 DHH family phosphoesterase [Heyndrickxia oleronia]MCI1614055.1 DHH family phosphoesterase [Heyndrickxia oleronia]MCI1744292.1 DHH family phosphoesterase [Heyndrickxia oleronia]
MPSNFNKRMVRYPLYGLLAVSLALLVLIGFYHWWITVIGLLLLGALFYLAFFLEQKSNEETLDYISTLSYRIKRVGEEALMEMPIGIMLINDDLFIEWTNQFMASCFNEETLVGRSLYDVAEDVVPLIKQEIDSEMVSLNGRKYRVTLKLEEKLLYFFDVTEQSEIEKLYKEERTVIAIIFLDNYDEVTQGMDDQTRSSLNSLVTSILNKWAMEYGVFLKRVSSERFISVLNEKILLDLEKSKFSILDEVRETTSKQNIPLTLSIGIGAGVPDLPDLGVLAQSSLDIALGRGGDQVAMKEMNGKVKFYGGKTNPMEKRTRVRARVISHALKELMTQSDKIFVMGHKFPDMDAVGAAIGVRKVAEMNGKEGYIVINFSEIDTGVKRLIEEVKQYPDLYTRFITPEEALEMATEDSLLVVVDTHKPSFVIDDRLIKKIENIVVIDHHRRGEDFIKNPLLVYMEPYASSTAELVTELLEYQPKNEKVNMLEATALLAGIIVDTKSFTLRTGSRTFDAASYLRGQGADTVLVQKFLKEDLNTYIKRAKLIESVAFYRDGIAIGVGTDDTIYNSVLIAQAADTLLTMDGVEASFVVSKRSEDEIGISARSLGKVNVQVIMESLGGGGHLSNAATQLKDTTIEDAKEQLLKAIDDYLEGSQKS